MKSLKPNCPHTVRPYSTLQPHAFMITRNATHIAGNILKKNTIFQMQNTTFRVQNATFHYHKFKEQLFRQEINSSAHLIARLLGRDRSFFDLLPCATINKLADQLRGQLENFILHLTEFFRTAVRRWLTKRAKRGRKSWSRALMALFEKNSSL